MLPRTVMGMCGMEVRGLIQVLFRVPKEIPGQLVRKVLPVHKG